MNEIHTGPNAKIQEQRIKGRLPSDIQLARHKEDNSQDAVQQTYHERGESSC